MSDLLTVRTPSSAGDIAQRTNPLHGLAAEVQVDGRWLGAGHGGSRQGDVDDQFGVKWSQDGARGSLTITPREGGNLNLQRMRVVVTVPLLTFARVLIPDCGRHYINA